MAKQYTAQEMRDAILKLKAFQGNKMTLLRIEDMLRQAADEMERKKKYEYRDDGSGFITQKRIPGGV